MAKNRIKIACKVVLIGGSTGSIDVLLQVLPALQSPLPVAVVLVLHRRNTADSTLANLFAQKTTLPVQEVEEKDVLRPGVVYVAPADYHLLLERDGTVSLDDSEKVHFSRPAIDVTFESAADAYGPAVVAVLLSGANADGANGMMAVKRAGGVLVVQQPETAQVAFMPQQALLTAPVDYVLSPAELAPFINGLDLTQN